jgi:hypothetical protein
LGYEIADNTTIINVHSGSISVENSGNSYLCRGTNFILDILDMGKSKNKERTSKAIYLSHAAYDNRTSKFQPLSFLHHSSF